VKSLVARDEKVKKKFSCETNERHEKRGWIILKNRSLPGCLIFAVGHNPVGIIGNSPAIYRWVESDKRFTVSAGTAVNGTKNR
jgi:hypothetical protein